MASVSRLSGIIDGPGCLLSAPSFSVLTAHFLHPSLGLTSSDNASLVEVFAIAHNVVALLRCSTRAGTTQPSFTGDGSSGDPALIDMAVLFANWTGLSDEDYAGAVTGQVNYLFGSAVPNTKEGAISLRISQLELW